MFVGVLAAAAWLTPIWAPEPSRAGGLLLFCGAAAEPIQGFRRRTAEGQRGAWIGAGLTLLLGVLVFNAAWIAGTAVTLVVAAAIRAGRHPLHARRDPAGRQPRVAAGAPSRPRSATLAVTIGLILLGRYAFRWVIAAAAGTRLSGTAINLVAAPVYTGQDADESVIADIGIDRPERLAETGARLQREEENRIAADRSWVGRPPRRSCLRSTSAAWASTESALGILSPLVAVIGDVGLRRSACVRRHHSAAIVLPAADPRPDAARLGMGARHAAGVAVANASERNRRLGEA